MASRKLTDKQQAFVAEFLVDLNATQAAIRAGYSVKTAYAIGEENLKKPEIAHAIAQAKAERAEKTQRTALNVLKDIQDVSKEARDGGDLKTALKGYELEGKHLGMFKERMEHSGKDGAPIAVEHGVSPAVEAVLKSLREVTA